MNIHLLLHNILYLSSILLSFFFILFLFFKAKKDAARTTLILAFFSTIIFITSHVLGASVTDSELSRKILMFNLINIFLPIFSTHCVLVSIGKIEEQKNILISLYLIGIGLLVFFLANPSYFLVTSVPKMYFPNYYVAGPYYFLMLLFFFFGVIYSLYIMRKAYITSNGIEKNRIKYFAIALFFAYSIGSIAFLLIYNIPVDPLWASFFVPLFTVPFTYAIVKYELMDIKLITKKAFVFIVISAVIGFILILFNYINNLVIQRLPEFPNWISPVILTIATSIGLLFVWRKIRETDLLKYEFVDIITHKFRTPLTAIKWFSENLIKSVPEDSKEDIINILKSTKSLIDLTNLLANLSITDKKIIEYNFTKLNLNNLIQNILSEYSKQIKEKNIILLPLPSSNNFVLVDEQKIKFVFQTLINNAINYNKQDGNISIQISTIKNEKKVIVEITDTGIGINEEEIKYIFTKFYRTESSKKADTEGLGIGLHLTKIIIEKHDGEIWVKSGGHGKGSSFFVSLPIYKE